jgi:hypothetical protein
MTGDYEVNESVISVLLAFLLAPVAIYACWYLLVCCKALFITSWLPTRALTRK